MCRRGRQHEASPNSFQLLKRKYKQFGPYLNSITHEIVDLKGIIKLYPWVRLKIQSPNLFLPQHTQTSMKQRKSRPRLNWQLQRRMHLTMSSNSVGERKMRPNPASRAAACIAWNSATAAPSSSDNRSMRRTCSCGRSQESDQPARVASATTKP